MVCGSLVTLGRGCSLGPLFYTELPGHIVSIHLISVTLFNALEILNAVGYSAKGIAYQLTE